MAKFDPLPKTPKRTDWKQIGTIDYVVNILFILLFHQHSISQNMKTDKFRLGHNVDRNRQDKTRLGRAF